MNLRSRLFPLAALTTSAALIAGCGSSTQHQADTSSSTPTPHSTTTASGTSGPAKLTKTQAAKQFQADLTPFNTAVNKYTSQAKGLTSTKAEKLSGPAVEAYRTLNGKLMVLAKDYPPAASRIQEFITTDTTVAQDLQNLSRVSETQFTSDLTKEKAAVNSVLSDLGLNQLGS